MGKSDEESKKEDDIQKLKLQRSHLQGVVRGHINKISRIVYDDDIRGIAECEDQLKKLTSANEQFSLVHDQFLVACAAKNTTPKEQIEKTEGLRLDSVRVSKEAADWIVSMSSRSTYSTPISSPLESTVIAGRANPDDFSAAFHEQGFSVISQEDHKDEKLREYEDKIQRMRERLEELEYKESELDGFKRENEKLHETLGHQRTRHDEDNHRHRDTIVSLQDKLARVDEEAEKGTHGDQRTRPPDLDRSSFGQEDLFAISHVVTQNSMEMMKGLLDHSMQQQRSLLTNMRAPTVELLHFDGNPINYHKFINRFDELIGKTDDTCSVKLTTLLQHCDDCVLSHLDCCNYKRSEEGYRLARLILRNKFGNPYLIAQAWVERLSDYPKLSSPLLLEKFSGEIKSAMDSLSSLGFLSELECTKSLTTITAKLPYYLQNKWRAKYRESMQRGRIAKLKELVELITNAAEEANDPVYGQASLEKISAKMDVKAKATVPQKKKTTYYTEEHETEQFDAELEIDFMDQKPDRPRREATAQREKTEPGSCFICKGTHYTSNCFTFLDMSSHERLKFVIEHKLCLLCLGTGHRVDACVKTWVCRRPGCQQRHNGNLHLALTSRAKSSVATVEIESESQSGVVDAADEKQQAQLVLETNLLSMGLPHRDRTKYVNMLTYQLDFDHTLPVVPIVLKSERGWVRTNALIDTGSTATICTRRTQELLQFKPTATQTVLVKGVAGEQTMTSEVVNMEVRGLESEVYMRANDVTFLSELEIATGHVKRMRNLETWEHLKNLKIPQHEDYDVVDLLIGQDNAHLFKQDEVIDGGDMYAPYAVRTPLGWTVFGHYVPNLIGSDGSVECLGPDELGFMSPVVRSNLCNRVRRVTTVEEDRSLEKCVAQQWKLDEVPEVVPISPINKRILNMWEKSIRLKNGHWEAPIPYKREPPFLKDNLKVVRRKLDQLGRRLEKRPEIKEQYVKSMRANFDKGYAREASHVPYPGYEYYHPHQEVITPRRPGKCRIVGNLSFVCYEESLNTAVYQGPDLTTPLVEVLIQFRLYRYAFTTDIAAMYNQVKVPDKQCDSLRFLWWKDDSVGGEVIACQMTTHMFGGSWCPSVSSFALQHTARVYGHEYDENVVATVMKNFYVDDLLKSIMSLDIGVRLIKQLREMLARVGFELAKFGANDLALLVDVPRELMAKAYEDVVVELTDEVQDKTLGTSWGPKKDVFSFSTVVVEKPCTRRGILSTFSSVYDPLGFAAPFILRARQLIQELCAESYGWDEDLPQPYRDRWNEWIEDLTHLAELRIPRWLGVNEENRAALQIHAFSDASERGYGAVLYLCVTDEGGVVVQAKLLMAKARVSPIKPVSIPRLELVAAVLSTKMVNSVTRCIDETLKPPVFWVDSTIVLYYIRQQAREFRTFVANRVSYIHDYSEPEQWKHVPGELNIADVASRGLRAKELVVNEAWLDGPRFLFDRERWPAQPGEYGCEEAEVRKRTICVMQMNTVKVSGVLLSGFREIVEGISEWVKLVRVIGYLIRFARYCRERVHNAKKLTAREFEDAELRVVRLTQELWLTQSQRDSKAFRRLFPFDADGVQRVGGRLMLSHLRFEEKYPAILPRSLCAELYVRYIHIRNGHVGVERTFMEVRRKYWLIGGKALVKTIVHRCLVCRKIRGRPGEQMMSPLPAFRVNPGQMPFEHVGVDYAGPIYVKVGRSMVKRWICVITCFAIRAVHLELAFELSASSFLFVLQRFIARRGKPALVVSDNGSNFVGAVREMKQAMSAWNETRIQGWMMEEGITWQFNTPTASHHGGAWERMIRTYRELTMALAGQQTLTDESAMTFLCNVEQIMNSRPLCKVSEDPQEELPLTPNHLLMVPKTVNLPGVYVKRDGLQRRWKQTEYMADQFWQRWVGTYLKSLQERKKWLKEQTSFAVGDLVLLVAENAPRLKWPLGLIVQVFPGKDGQVRSVRVKTQDGVYERPISKLVRLECDY